MKTKTGIPRLALKAFIFLLVGIYALSVWQNAHAQQPVYIKGSSSAILSGKCLRDDAVRGKRDKETFNETLRKAKVNAVRRYVANSGISVADAYDAKRAEIEDNIDEYILNEKERVFCERGKKNLQIGVTGELDTGRLDRTLALNQIRMARRDRSRLTSIFVAREQKDVRAFRGRETQISRTTDISEASQAAEVGADGSMMAEGKSVTTRKTETGGSTKYRADKIEYGAFRPENLEIAINSVFTSLGYRVVKISQIEDFSDGQFERRRFEEEYASEENIGSKTLNSAFKAIKVVEREMNTEIPLLGIFKLDVGAPITNDNGDPMVVVDVKAEVLIYDEPFYDTVASYGPVQIQSSGITSTAAKNNAILEAAREAASQLGAQMLQNNIY